MRVIILTTLFFVLCTIAYSENIDENNWLQINLKKCLRTGKDCESDDQCCKKYRCNSSNKCERACQKEGDKCQKHIECCLPLRCNKDSNVCEKRTCHTENEWCIINSQCCWGFRCNTLTHQCEKKECEENQQCARTTDCCRGRLCINKQCVQICKSEGSLCINDLQCCDNLECNKNKHICKKRCKNEDSQCSQDSECCGDLKCGEDNKCTSNVNSNSSSSSEE